MNWLTMLLLPSAFGVHTVNASWVAPLIAVWPVAGLMAWIGRWHKRNPDICPSQLGIALWGPAAGRGVQAAWGLWALCLAAYNARFMAGRLEATVFAVRDARAHLVIGLLLCGVMACNGEALVRAGRVFAAGALSICAAILCLLPPGIQWRYLAVGPADVKRLPELLPAALSVCALVLYGFFLKGGHCLKYTLPAAPVLSLITAATVGTFGPALAAALPFGFFWAIKNAAVPGGMRMEAIFVMLWLAVDLTVISLLIRAALLLFRAVSKIAAAVAAALVLTGGMALRAAGQEFLETAAVYGSAGLLFALPLVMMASRRRTPAV